MVTATRFIIGFTQVASGIISLAFSGWQYQNNSGDITISYFDPSSKTFSVKSLSDTCTLFPYEYLRRKYSLANLCGGVYLFIIFPSMFFFSLSLLLLSVSIDVPRQYWILWLW